MNTLLTRTQVAAMLAVSLRTVDKLRKAGTLPFVKMRGIVDKSGVFGRRAPIRFVAQDVEDAIKRLTRRAQ